MTNLKDYEAMQKAALALKQEEIKEPRIPIVNYLQEAEDLGITATVDFDQLKVCGLTKAVIDAIPVCAGAVRQAQSNWVQEKQTQEKAEKQWSEEAPLAFELRDILLHTFRFAYRKDKDLMRSVNLIAEGDGNADMIQDLNDLATMGKKHQEQLKAIAFDLKQLDVAATKSDQMATLLATANGDRNSDNSTLEMRNRMYTLLKEKVDEVREYGKFVFWKDEQRVKLYASAYERRLNQRRKQKKINNEEI